MTDITISPEDPGTPDVLALLMAGEAYGAALYPAESNHYLPLDALRTPEVLFLVARDAAGTAIGTGAIVANGDWAEIKRMWVDPAARGKGLSKRLLNLLEAHVLSGGIRTLRLETGIHNTEASGYTPVWATRCATPSRPTRRIRSASSWKSGSRPRPAPAPARRTCLRGCRGRTASS